MKQNNPLFISFFIVLFGSLLFMTGIGRVHLFDWDEINFAESAREMLVTGDYLNVRVNYEMFWEKPPLFIWMQALSMKVFGVNEFAARFPNAVCGIITLFVLFHIGRKLKNEAFGLLWTALYAVSFLPFFYFKSGIIDPWFNLFIFLGIYFMALYTSPENEGKKGFQAVSSALFLGLAVLTKGPVAFLIFLLCFFVYLLFNRFRMVFKWRHVVAFTAVFTVVGGLWFILQIVNGNLTIIQDFIVYQIRLFRTEDAGHGGFPLYHFVILFFGVFPASMFALPTFRKRVLSDESNRNTAHFFRWMMITLWVVLILFTIVRTKIVHYSSMCYFPITFLAAWHIDKWMAGKAKVGKLITVPMLIIAWLVCVAVAVIPFFDLFKQRLVPYVNDEFAVGNMQATAHWVGFEWIIGLILIAAALFFVLSKNRKPVKSLNILFLGCLAFIYLGMFFITPQIEKYSQNAAIEFYKNKSGEDCYIYPMFKTYAHYFYSNRQPQNNNADADFLQHGNIDKPAYFVLKNEHGNEERFKKETPDALKLYNKNGFIFYVRHPD